MADSGFLDTFAALGEALGDAGDAVLRLPVELIDEDPDNPRRAFDEAELTALAQTIAERGLLQPIVVRAADRAGRYQVRFGARRLRAARRAGLVEIPALVRPGGGEGPDGLLEQLIENDQREGLTTAELARAVDRLMASGLNQAEIGRRLGRSKPQIAMLAAIKSMAPELRALAPKLGARTLYELHAAWKADAEGARKFLKGRRPESITQAEARELAGRRSPRIVRDPSDGSTRALSPPEAPEAPSTRGRPSGDDAPAARDRTAAVPSPAPASTAVFEVETQGRRGTLVLDNVSAPGAKVVIELAGGGRRTVAAKSVTLVRVRPG